MMVCRSIGAVCVTAAVVTAPAAAAAASASAGRDPQRVDYTIDVNLDAATHELTGHERVSLVNSSSKALREIWLHLYLNAFSNAHTTFFREANGGRGTDTPDHWGYSELKSVRMVTGTDAPVELWPQHFDAGASSDDRTDVRITLPTALAPGAAATLLIDFHAQLPEVVERTGYGGSFHMVGQWFPKLAKLNGDGSFAHFPLHHFSEFYADFGRYDVTMRVPESFAVVATGERQWERVEEGRRVVNNVQNDVHDFAFAAWDKFRFLEANVSGRRIVVAYPPGFDAVAQRELDTAAVALDEFSTWYGPYPYKILSVVHPPSGSEEAGGMEYPTLITTGGSWATPKGLRSIELVTVHELGHQWFYGLLASNELASPFLDEGFNTFAEARWMGAHAGDASLLDLGPLKLADECMYAAGSAKAVSHSIVGARADQFSSGADYGALVYGRTGTLLASLRRVYGAAPFDAAMRAYGDRFRFEHPTPADAEEVFREHLGAEAARVFHQGISEQGWIDFELVSLACRTKQNVKGYVFSGVERSEAPGGDAAPKVKVSAVRGERRGTMALPTEVEVTFEDGRSERHPWPAGDRSFERTFEGGECVVQASIDPDRRVLIDAQRANDTRTTETRKAPFFSGVARTWLAAIEALFAWVGS